MPIFDYKCRSCSHQFEKMVRGSEIALCPSCNLSDLEKLLSVPGISTQKSRQHSFGIAQQAAKAVKKEQNHAQREYERNYIKDHS
ncbi:MAG: FmdB family zinc ribbon protein [Pseudohongiellaceae bacterium]|jgi:putative FmdB family regulatory protein